MHDEMLRSHGQCGRVQMARRARARHLRGRRAVFVHSDAGARARAAQHEKTICTNSTRTTHFDTHAKKSHVSDIVRESHQVQFAL